MIYIDFSSDPKICQSEKGIPTADTTPWNLFECLVYRKLTLFYGIQLFIANLL